MRGPPPHESLAPVHWFATTPKGTERALRDELSELGFAGVRAERGGVHFEGEWAAGYRACLWSRVAVRVLLPISEFECYDEASLYDGVLAHDFADVLTPRHTLVVSAACRDSRITHTQYIAQKTKDAIVDRLRGRFGVRPDVDRNDPDVHVFVHLVRNHATVYLDLAGEPLHRRGYRQDGGAAPLKENLAAAILRLTGFRGDAPAPVLDPMCGSGTLLIEAALWAENRAPGALRRRFGFERWASFGATEQKLMAELREEARAGVREGAAPVVGTDLDADVVAGAAANATRAGVRVTVTRGEARDARPDAPYGVLVTNPPYGERLARSSNQPREIARLVDRFPKWDVGVLTSSEQPFGRTRRKPFLHTLFNGDIECALRSYEPIASGTAEAPEPDAF